MACKIHGITNCKLPSCLDQQTVLCDAHLMENCHLCATVQNPRPTNPAVTIGLVVKNPTEQLLPPITDPHASKVLAAAEAYAQARQDMAAIRENVRHLKQNLQFAKEKFAEALKTKQAAKKALAALTRGKEEVET